MLILLYDLKYFVNYKKKTEFKNSLYPDTYVKHSHYPVCFLVTVICVCLCVKILYQNNFFVSYFLFLTILTDYVNIKFKYLCEIYETGI